MRMHTDPSIALLEAETEQLYAHLRKFSDSVCVSFDTLELRREAEARQRAKQRRDAKAASSDPSIAKKGKGKEVPTAASTSQSSGPRRKQYHLKTVKHHFLPDYPKIIREYGTTDSYSTEPVRLPLLGPLAVTYIDFIASRSLNTEDPSLGTIA